MPTVLHTAIEGVIGVGKTSLVHRLHADRGGERYLEIVEENPFLVEGFYRDMDRYAFDTEMFFLLSRFRQQRELLAAREEEGDEPIWSDYVFEKNRIFSELTLEGEDYRIWRRLFDALAAEVDPPDLVVYLRADTDTLLDRIRTRSRPFEKDISRNYVERLNRAYDAFFDDYRATRLLTIDVSRLDFVRSEADYASVVAMLDHTMAAVESGQGELDLIEAAR